MVSSVFDLTETVSQIIEVERVSLDRRISENEKRDQEIENLDTVKSRLQSFLNRLGVLENAATFHTKSATVSDSTVVRATPDVGAAEILFDISVTTLAEAARTQSTDTLFGADREGSAATLTGGEINPAAGQDLDPNANAVSGNPNFEDGGNLSAGSFEINNATIMVTSSDTVNTILTKINNSSADVTASYDEGNDKIVIEHNKAGNAYSIELGSDSTGFFEKLKLSGDPGVVSQEGVDADLYRPLGETALGAVVGDGYFTVNDRTFWVDADSNSLNDVILRINNSSAGVSIFYDVESDKVTLTSKNEGEDIVLENDTSGFLDAIEVLGGAESEHTYTGSAGAVTINGTDFTPESNELTIHGTTLRFRSTGSATVKIEPDRDRLVDAVSDMASAYNDAASAIEEVLEGDASTSQFLYRLMSGLRTRLQSSIENSGTYNYLNEVGVDFTRGITGGRMEVDESKLRERLKSDLDSVASLFSFDSDQDGLRDDGGIANSVEDYLENYTRGTLGFIDRRKEVLESVSQNIQRQINRQEEYFVNREAFLLESMIQTQNLLEKLQEQYTKASNIRVDFTLITGNALYS
jgi:flagellar hook-associated protein 2